MARIPWEGSVTAPVPNSPVNAGSWLGRINSLYYSGQSVGSGFTVLFVCSNTKPTQTQVRSSNMSCLFSKILLEKKNSFTSQNRAWKIDYHVSQKTKGRIINVSPCSSCFLLGNELKLHLNCLSIRLSRRTTCVFNHTYDDWYLDARRTFKRCYTRCTRSWPCNLACAPKNINICVWKVSVTESNDVSMRGPTSSFVYITFNILFTSGNL